MLLYFKARSMLDLEPFLAQVRGSEGTATIISGDSLTMATDGRTRLQTKFLDTEILKLLIVFGRRAATAQLKELRLRLVAASRTAQADAQGVSMIAEALGPGS